MRKVRIVFVGLLILSLLLGAVGCAAGEKYPSDYETLSALIGQPINDACTKLNIQQSALTEVSKGMYSLPQTAEFAGVTFAVYLRVNLQEGLVSGIRYEAVYENQPKQAAKDIAAVAKQLSKGMGKTHVKEETVISDFKESELAEIFSGKDRFNENNFWDLTESAGAEVRSYLEYLKETPGWEAYAKQGDPHFYLDLDVVYTPNNGKTGIILTYAAEADRGSGDYREVDGGIAS